MNIKICVGSSCHLKGSPEIVELMQRSVEEHGISDKVTLSGSFCIGKCNRVGVSRRVNIRTRFGCGFLRHSNVKTFSNTSVLSDILPPIDAKILHRKFSEPELR